MRHLRQRYNQDLFKRASLLNKSREEYGWMSDIMGQVVDKPSKLRGDRFDRLFFEESGSNPVLIKTYLQGNALVEVLGKKLGTRFVWGTGGDSGPSLDGLSDMFYNPEAFNMLPYKHNYTKDGSTIYSCFFIPAFTFVAKKGYIDNRGVTNIEKAKEFYLQRRNALLSKPKAHLIECAEFCFTPEDALALEGENQFNTVLLSEQLTRIKIYKDGPEIKHGQLEYIFKNNVHTEENVDKVKFVPTMNGKVHIMETPILDASNNIPRNLYVAGIDGIDLGQEETSEKTTDPSDFCVVIFKRSFGLEPPKIVAYYKDRPQKLKDAHMTCLKLLQYYNAKAVVEKTRMSIKQFFVSKKLENRFLFRRPRATQGDIQRGKSKEFGAPATTEVIKHQLDLISLYIEDYCDEIWFLEVLEEAIKYSFINKRKFDIIAAWGMAMLADEELSGIVPAKEDSENVLEFIGYYIDENGIKRKGVIPNKQTTLFTNFNFYKNYDDDRPRTSDPRFN